MVKADTSSDQCFSDHSLLAASVSGFVEYIHTVAHPIWKSPQSVHLHMVCVSSPSGASVGSQLFSPV